MHSELDSGVQGYLAHYLITLLHANSGSKNVFAKFWNCYNLLNNIKFDILILTAIRSKQQTITYSMNSNHRKTLNIIFTDPINGNVEWRKIEALFLALGAEKDEGTGSAVSFFLNGKRADFHRPHPNKEALRYRVKAAREFLENAGVKP